VSWRLDELSVEAFRNALAAPIRTAVVIGVMSGAMLTVTASEVAFTRELVDFQARSLRAGSSVAVVTSNSGALPPAPCLALQDHDGVRWAGTLAAGSPVELSKAPGILVQSGSASYGALELWTDGTYRPTDGSPGLVVGGALAEEMGLGPNSIVQPIDDDPGRVAAVIDTEKRNPAISRWLLTPTHPVAPVDACWIEFAPGTLVAGLELLQVTYGGQGADVSIQPWLRSNELARQPAQEFESRTSRYAWVACGLLILLVSLLIARTRRAEIGLYRSAGTTTAQLLFMAQVETLQVVAVGGAIGALWGIVLAGGGPAALSDSTVLSVALRSALCAGCFTVALAPLARLIVARGSVVSQLKGE